MSKVPHFVYTARPTIRVRLKGLFETGPLKEVLEKPQVLRANGWTMETQQEARIVKGEYLEIVLGDWKTIQLYEDGMLLAKVRADADFLAWGSRGDEGFEKRPRLNPLALIEFTYSFTDVFSRVLEYAEPQPVDCVMQANIQNAIRESGPLYLNPYGLETCGPPARPDSPRSARGLRADCCSGDRRFDSCQCLQGRLPVR